MRILFLLFALCLLAAPAHAEFLVSNAILEFGAQSPSQQDIEIISRSREGSDYITTEVSEILHPGTAQEQRLTPEDPAETGLLVTPDRNILPAGSRKLLRFVLLSPPGPTERIYRVAVKPVIKGVDQESRLGIKVLVGYEVLVIVRPATPNASYHAERRGTQLHVTNSGNTNILFQNGQQCVSKSSCITPPVLRVYPGQSTHLDLPHDAPVQYSVWDGQTTTQRHFD